MEVFKNNHLRISVSQEDRTNTNLNIDNGFHEPIQIYANKVSITIIPFLVRLNIWKALKNNPEDEN